MAKIRFALRGKATLLMGKNTMMRKVISTYVKEHSGHPYEQVSIAFSFASPPRSPPAVSLEIYVKVRSNSTCTRVTRRLPRKLRLKQGY